MIYLTTPHNSSSNFFQEPSFINILWALRNFRFGEINAWINVLQNWTPIIYFETKPVLSVLDKENNSNNKKQSKARGLKVQYLRIIF